MTHAIVTRLFACNGYFCMSVYLTIFTVPCWCSELQAVGVLLGVQHGQLQKGLTLRTYNSGEEIVQSQCSAAAVGCLV